MTNALHYLSISLDVMGANPIQYIHFDPKQYEAVKNNLLGCEVIDENTLKYNSDGYVFILKFEYIKLN